MVSSLDVETCQVPMAHRRARDLLAAMTAFAGTDNFVEATVHLQFQKRCQNLLHRIPDSWNISSVVCSGGPVFVLASSCLVDSVPTSHGS